MSPAAHAPHPIPQRSAEQRAAALAKANRVRSFRAQLKRDLKAGDVDPIDALRRHPEDLATMKVEDFLMALPWVGAKRAARFHVLLKIARGKTIGGLTPRQRVDLEWGIDRYTRTRGDAYLYGDRP